MAKYIPESKYIASIYASKLEPLKFSHGSHWDSKQGRSTTYWIPPLKRGWRTGSKHIKDGLEGIGPDNKRNHAVVRYVQAGAAGGAYVMEVTDAFESVLNVAESSESGKQLWSPRPVTCEEIVPNILNIWSGSLFGVPDGASPGIMEISGEVPHQSEMDRMFELQTRFYEFMFQEGERLASDTKDENSYKRISDVMRDAAEWFGYTRNWVSPGKVAAELVPCPACFKLKPAAASVCHNCGRQIAEMPKEVAALNVGAA